MKKTLPTACTAIATILLTSVSASAHPGHPGHEHWPFDDLKMAALICVPIVAFGLVMFVRKLGHE